jgi:RAB protein geranylgeranyltransferase component A
MDSHEENDSCDDGLKDYYDLVLLGTGLVQAIISCAASKNGIKVLHLDKNSFYGEEYSSHTLSAHLNHYKCMSNVYPHAPLQPSSPGTNQFLLKSEFHEVHIAKFHEEMSSQLNCAVANKRFSSATFHPACLNYSMQKTAKNNASNESYTHHPVFSGYVCHNSLTKGRLWLRDRDFNIDTSAKALYGSGSLIDLLINSGVADYLEFKAFEGLYFWVEGNSSSTAEACTIKKVPCSRGDVFNSTLLGPLEKRTLMKFHQFVADWGRVNCGTELSSLNETELAIGRSLYRPQNKQHVYEGFNIDKFADRPIGEFLDDCKLSLKLQRIIIYALCCHMQPLGSHQYLTRDALRDMFLHVDSIGRFGETGFLSPLYGSSEVVQSFCRMSAVWGGTFILGRSITRVTLANSITSPSFSNDTLQSSNSEFENSEQLPPQSPVLCLLDSLGTTFGCKSFVCSAGYWPNITANKSCLKVCCTSIWLGSVIPLPRSVIVIPPAAPLTAHGAEYALGSLKNTYAIHIIQSDASTKASPEGSVILHICTLIDCILEPQHEKLCWTDVAKSNEAVAVDLVSAIIAQLQASFLVTAPVNACDESCGSACEELSRVVTLQPVYDAKSIELCGLPPCIKLCTEASDASLTMQAAYEQAQQYFLQLFPEKDFSLNSEELARALEAARQQFCGAAEAEVDDEASFLEYALQNAQECPNLHQENEASLLLECGTSEGQDFKSDGEN